MTLSLRTWGKNLGVREVFDVTVAKEVAERRISAEYCLPLVRVGALIVAAKGQHPQVAEEYRLVPDTLYLTINYIDRYLSGIDWCRLQDDCCDRTWGKNLGVREVFGVSVAKAVSERRILAEYCLPSVRVGALIVAAKGQHPQEGIRGSER